MDKVYTYSQTAKSNHSTRPQAAANRPPEHQEAPNGPKLALGDSTPRGTRPREPNNEIQTGYAKFKTLPGADPKETLHYVNPTPESGNHDPAAPHPGVNDPPQKTISKSDSVENLIENRRKTAAKCMSHGVQKPLRRQLCEIEGFPNRF